jgi:hypothetical protein
MLTTNTSLLRRAFLSGCDFFKGVKTMSNEQRIAQAAMTIAGSIFEECNQPTLVDKLRHCCSWRNQGTDGDLTRADRESLQLLLDEAEAAAGVCLC